MGVGGPNPPNGCLFQSTVAYYELAIRIVAFRTAMPVNKTAQTSLKSFFLLLVVDILAHGSRDRACHLISLARILNGCRDNEAFRGASHVVKGKASHQCQRLLWRAIQNGGIGGCNDLDSANGVPIRPSWAQEFDSVARSNVLKPSEKAVTMSGYTEIARLTDSCRAKDSSDSTI